MNWIIVAIVLLMAHKEYMASPIGQLHAGHTHKLTPYIKYWEAANFDRRQLHEAHERHSEQKRHRRRRDLNAGEYGPAHTIRLNFFAHDREFRLVLRQDPLSVFANDVQIENTLGPMDYDISRIYTGSLEDDENSHIHAILTNDNLLDGTIETSTDHYYLEPSLRYSDELPKSGIHTIVYKVSDVKAKKAGAAAEDCASERLRKSMLFDDLKRRKFLQDDADVAQHHHQHQHQQQPKATAAANDSGSDDSDNMRHRRSKRWLPDELPSATRSDNQRDPPLPLDLDVPYNDDFNSFTHHEEERTSSSSNVAGSSKPKSASDNKTLQSSVITWRNVATAGTTSERPSIVRNRNIIVNNYNPNPSLNNSSVATYNTNNWRKTYTKHKNIIVSTYNRSAYEAPPPQQPPPTQPQSPTHHGDFVGGDASDDYPGNDSGGIGEYPNTNGEHGDNAANSINLHNNYVNNFFNTNWTTLFVSSNNNDRPSHKTHVEIITKNGATKKPNIIVNNYNPDIMLSPNLHNPNFNSMLMTNLLSGRGPGGEGGPMGGGSSRSLYDRKITCMLYLQADHTFFQKMGSDEASIEAITRHVQRANSIYKNTDFNNDGKPDNITFMIKRIKVHNTDAVKDPAYRFPGNYGVEKFLELFSEEDYDAFCLAYMFTYRDFEMGTLGLAWTGDLKNAGGVCEKNGHYRGSLKSLNTGIVTLLNYGKHVPPAVSHVTLAHEIGHNFGSPHDPEQCTPGGEDGNYIMFARATSGDKKNNNKFSPCSLKSIEPVLNAKARSVKGCFTEPQSSICGNGVVEPGEQCDCGWEEDCMDSCCFPMSRNPPTHEKPCTLTPRAMCSPSQGPCCTTDCKVKFGDKCRDDNGCRDPSFCDGRMPQCPPSVNKPNKTICNKEFVCYMGDCTGSICLAYGLESCQCIPGPGDDKIKSCELCCKLPGEENPCRSSFEWNEPPFDVPDMYAKPGTPCNDYNGYCDVFQKCREVDPSGPLATLRKLLLSEESIATFKKWMQHNWYTVALAAIGVIVLLILSTKLLAKRSNLKLKSVTIIHSATTETVRLPDDNNGVIVHTAVRTKVPFKKKVRGERSGVTSSSNNNSSNNNSGSKGGGGGHKASTSKMVKSSSHSHGRLSSKVLPPTDPKKPLRSKKNRVAGTAAQQQSHTAATVSQPKASATNAATSVTAVIDASAEAKAKTKKLKKPNKEIIDYSARTSQGGVANHTNTFGKVQKWLLESPIVAQPLSHIEHSAKVRKVMSKSQSTPERLVQKSPSGNVGGGGGGGSATAGNEKVKLQVVYKPPFKFSLRFSKNPKVKTHVVGGNGAIGKTKRHSRTTDNLTKRLSTGSGGAANMDQAKVAASGPAENTKRAALLLRGTDHDDNQILTLNEPNYETLNPKFSKAENPFYENMQYQQLSGEAKPATQPATAAVSGSSQKMSRSSSKTNLDGQAAKKPHSYSRSHSLSASNPFAAAAAAGRSESRKMSDSTSIATNDLSRNFGSTQNLIHSSHSNLAKSKKRSSLNLKSTLSKNGKDPPVFPTKRSSSNMNLRRNSSSTNLQHAPGSSSQAVEPALGQSHPPPIHRSSSNNANSHAVAPIGPTSSGANTSHHPAAQPPQRTSRASFNNIPRASLSLSSTASAQSSNSGSGSSVFTRKTPPPVLNRSTSHQPDPHVRRSRGNSMHLQAASQSQPQGLVNAAAGLQQQRSNSTRQQHQHQHHPPPPIPPSQTVGGDRELPSDLEVMVSDVENLVS